MWYERLERWIATPLLLALLIIAWDFLIRIFAVSELILPAPAAVGRSLIDLVTDARTYDHTLVTLQEVLLGFAAAAIGGVVVGALIAKVSRLERLLHPLIVALQVAPKTPFVPLLIVWFGFGMTSKVVIAALMAFFPIFTNTVLGVKSTPEGLHDLFSVIRAKSTTRFFRLELPNAMPNILAGMEVGIVLAMIGAIVGEFLAGSRGLGYLTVAAMNNFQTARLFGVIILLTVVGFLLHYAVMATRKRLLYWHESANVR